jgi:hypothetical protein
VLPRRGRPLGAEAYNPCGFRQADPEQTHASPRGLPPSGRLRSDCGLGAGTGCCYVDAVFQEAVLGRARHVGRGGERRNDLARLGDRGEVAQSVEHTAENRGVAGSIPALAIRCVLGSVLRTLLSDVGLASGALRMPVSMGRWAIASHARASVRFDTATGRTMTSPGNSIKVATSADRPRFERRLLSTLLGGASFTIPPDRPTQP